MRKPEKTYPASPSAVRCVWQRHGLVVRYQRLLWLERKPAERGDRPKRRCACRAKRAAVFPAFWIFPACALE